MKKILTAIFIFLTLTINCYSQLEDRFKFLTKEDVEKYIQPFGTTLGMAFNSASYYSAKIPDFFGFSISFRGMYFLIPDEDLKFMPKLPQGYQSTEPTSTVYGGVGTAYYESVNGYIAYPSGLDKKNFLFGYPQISASLLGTEVMLRYLPTIKLGNNNDEEISMFGIGIKHSISRYIPLLPVDIAV
ncbi:MAG TPA: DUF6588 family protein, partial [Ignavibacteriaceae bacterium]|nr:DUF6588 family protein [Ignavibacteriaceae bacterium]